ncbi:MAG TPA: glycine zipper domain-containing protein [Candidatus Binatia bacterium]|jgi:hypothetical protein|nr:glycine zipper domain-containing protein [Candidatus Binatia bacterium]
MKRTSLGIILLAIALAIWARNEVTSYDEFVYGGGVLGVGTGAIIGAAAGDTVAGAVIGGPVGVLAGYFISDRLRKALDSNVAKRGRTESFVAADGKNTKG